VTAEYADKFAFATGFGEVISRHHRVHANWRNAGKVVQARRPGSFNPMSSDGSLLYTRTGQDDLILVAFELECTGPGNETNILKWYEAVERGWIVRGKDLANFSAFVLLMAFVRCAPSFGENARSRAIEMCKLLSRLIENSPAPAGIQFQSLIFDYPGHCGTNRCEHAWRACGEAAGSWYVEQAIRAVSLDCERKSLPLTG
jgi:hypothetical protein